MSQVKWQEFFDADVNLYNSYLNKSNNYGTLSRITKVTYRKEGVRKRVLELMALYKNLK